jgi:hypothetical protein
MKTDCLWVIAAILLTAGVAVHAADPSAEQPALRAEAPAILPAGPPVEAPKIDTRNGGTYTSGNWKYVYEIRAKGTRSEGRYGSLFYDGKAVAQPGAVNDHYATPWGKLYWWGAGRFRWGNHGWIPTPNKGRPLGKRLATPGGGPPPPPPVPKLTDAQIARLQKLLKDLGHDAYATRESAEEEIKKLGLGALEHVKKHVDNKDPEVAERAKRIVRHLEAMLPPKPSKVAVKLELDKKKYKVGERIRITLTFTNQGDRAVQMPRGGVYYPWQTSAAYVLAGPDGKPIAAQAGGAVAVPRIARMGTILPPNRPLKRVVYVRLLAKPTTPLKPPAQGGKDGAKPPAPQAKAVAYLQMSDRDKCLPLPKTGKYTLKFRMVRAAAKPGDAPAPVGADGVRIEMRQQGGGNVPVQQAQVVILNGKAIVLRGPEGGQIQPFVGIAESNAVTFEVAK